LAEGRNAVFSTEPDGLYQMGNLAIDRAVVPGLDVATLQAAKSHPEYLPSLKRAREELDEARRNYDLIVLDGPPVLACGEAELFCGAADGVIVVVRSGERPQRARSFLRCGPSGSTGSAQLAPC